jgi:AhpD family alkylhydroperoxidase
MFSKKEESVDEKLTNGFVDTKDSRTNNDKEILEKMLKENGKLSKAIQLMGKRSGAVSNFMKYRNQIFEEGPLSKKERFLIALAAAVALKSNHCIPVQANNAKKAGASEEEIIQTMLIVGVVSGNSPLNVAFQTFFENN